MQSGAKKGTMTVEGTVSGAFDSDGDFFALDSLAQTPSYNADGTLAYELAGPDFAGVTRKKTYTWNNGVYGGMTQWVKQ